MWFPCNSCRVSPHKKHHGYRLHHILGGHLFAAITPDCVCWIRSCRESDKGWSGGWHRSGGGRERRLFWSTQATAFWQSSVVTASVSEGLPGYTADMICGALTRPPPHTRPKMRTQWERFPWYTCLWRLLTTVSTICCCKDPSERFLEDWCDLYYQCETRYSWPGEWVLEWFSLWLNRKAKRATYRTSGCHNMTSKEKTSQYHLLHWFPNSLTSDQTSTEVVAPKHSSRSREWYGGMDVSWYRPSCD